MNFVRKELRQTQPERAASGRAEGHYLIELRGVNRPTDLFA